jgi:hypothetical protein
MKTDRKTSFLESLTLVAIASTLLSTLYFIAGSLLS